MFEILGYIFAAIIVIVIARLMYEIIRGAVIGYDLMRWKLTGVSWSKIRAEENYGRKLVKMFLKCWAECIGYNGQFSLSSGDKTWEGYGTGR